MIDVLIVVEGQNDAQAVRRALGDVDILWTEGFGLTREKITYLRQAARKRHVIVCTDPDRPGQLIRAKLERHVPGVKHVYVSQVVARDARTGAVGIEHAAPEEIRAAFSRVLTECSDPDHPDACLGSAIDANFEPWSGQALADCGLAGSERSADRRAWIGRRLGIGDTNAKQLCKRLNQLQILRADVEAFLEEWEGTDEEPEYGRGIGPGLYAANVGARPAQTTHS